MANIQRFQRLSATEQHLLGPDSPIWVSRCQLTRDMDTGKRLLQVRMVNQSEKRIRQVFLRILCRDAREQLLTQLEMVPMPVMSAHPGQIFGEDKVIEIAPAGTTFVEVYAQRVRFFDDSVWNERETDNYIAFAPPVKVRQEDENYTELSRRAVSGGVRNAFYFHSQQGVWTCTCGLPNSSRTLRCCHCGADRLYLERQMDPAGLTPPVKEPAPAASTPPVTLAPIVIQQPPAQERPRRSASTRRPAPTPPPQEEIIHTNPGKTAAIVLSVLALLLTTAFVAYHFLKPYLRYQNGIEQLREGNYDEARAIFEELGDYKDSPERIQESLLNKALAAMSDGKYEEAMELLKDLPEQQSYVADCLYSLGVLAYNNGDLQRAWDYVQQLEERFPDYDKLPQLRQYCSYSQGNQLAAEAAERDDPASRIAAYEQAIEAFSQAGDYGDSAERVLECRYRIAVEQTNLGQLQEAIEAFAELKGYKQSEQLRMEAMYRYATEQQTPDQTGMDYLHQLAEMDYPGAANYLARLDGSAFHFSLSKGSREGGAPVNETEDLKEIYIHYQVDVSNSEGAIPILAVFTLPDGREGRATLNGDHSASNTKAWSSLFPTDCTTGGTVTLKLYDSERLEAGPLQTFSFTYRYTPPATTPPTDDKQTENNKDDNKFTDGKSNGGK